MQTMQNTHNKHHLACASQMSLPACITSLLPTHQPQPRKPTNKTPNPTSSHRSADNIKQQPNIITPKCGQDQTTTTHHHTEVRKPINQLNIHPTQIRTRTNANNAEHTHDKHHIACASQMPLPVCIASYSLTFV